VSALMRKARAAHMQAIGEGKVLQISGPRGSGKTETFKDTCHMLGRVPFAIDASDDINVMNVQVAECIQKNTGGCPCEFCVVIDEASLCPAEVLSSVIDTLQRAGALVCVTFNPYIEGRHEVKLQDAICLEFTPCALDTYADAFLCAEGFAEMELAAKFNAVFVACKEHCTTRPSYEFNMRTMKIAAQAAGMAGRAVNFTNESKILANALAESFITPAIGPDKDVVKGVLEAEFGQVDVPDACMGKDATRVAAMVSQVARLRRCVCVTGKGHLKEHVDAISKAMDAESILVSEGEAGATSAGGCVGDFKERRSASLSADSPALVKAIKETMTKVGPVNIFLQGPLDDKALAPLLGGEVQFYTTSDGETLEFVPNMKFIILLNDCSTLTHMVPNLGCVGVGA